MRFLTLLIALGLLLSGTLFAASGPVAMVTSLDGELWVERPGQEPFRGYLDLALGTGDLLRTPKESLSALRLASGARLGLNDATRLELAEPSAVVLWSGTCWARLDQESEPIAVHAPGGMFWTRPGPADFLLEISGTRAVLLVLEGRVEYQAVDAARGLVSGTAEPGARVEITELGELEVSMATVLERRREAEEHHAEFHRWLRQDVLVPLAASHSHAAALAVEVVSEPDRALERLAVRAAGRYLPGAGGLLGRVFSRPAGPPEPEFPVGLAPTRAEVPSEVAFVWTRYRGHDDYLLLISREEDMAPVEWSARVTGTSYRYPSEAPALEPGATYFWRLVALQDELPASKASQTWFVVEADR